MYIFLGSVHTFYYTPKDIFHLNSNASSYLHDDALEEAASRGDLSLFLRKEKEGGQTFFRSLIVAMKYDHENIISYLWNTKYIPLESFLCVAVFFEKMNWITCCFKENISDFCGPLLNAIFVNNFSLVRLIFDQFSHHYDDIERMKRSKQNLSHRGLMLACEYKTDKRIISYLVNNIDDINILNDILYLAVANGNSILATEMFVHGANDAINALHIALETKHEEMIPLIISSTPSIPINWSEILTELTSSKI